MRSLITLLLSLTLIELFIGAGGRVFEFGALTLRMALFIVNLLLVTALWVVRGKIPLYVIILTISVIVVFIVYASIGLINGAPLNLVVEDIKPLSYFLSVIFFSFYIDSQSKVALMVSLLKKSSLFMAVAYLGIQILINLGFINFGSFYSYVNTVVSSSDFMFRGREGLFFYKGFVYMVVGLIFWIHSEKSKNKNKAIMLITVAVILTGTRGFIVMLALLYGLFYGIPLLLRLNVKILVLACVFIFGSIYFFGTRDIGDKLQSDSARIKQIIEVTDDINLTSLFIGHGFGNGVPVRPVHMEIGYLEVFHKQGLLGLCIWALFFLILYNAYAKFDNLEHLRKAFLLGVSFVILLSFTNPFFNNPLGISMFIIALVSLKVLNHLEIDEKNTHKKLIQN